MRTPTLPGRLLAPAAVLVTGALLAGCSSPSTDTPTDSPTPAATSPSASAAPSETVASLSAYYDQKLAWTGCGGSFQCAKLTVPVDYAKPTGDTMQISVIRLRASDQGNRIGSLVLNPGGPGGSGVDYARAARAVVDDSVRERYDVVGFDPRGVARSSPVECLDDRQTDAFLAADGSPDDSAEVAQLEKLSKQFADTCKARSSKILAHIDTESAARDVDVLRAALGDQKLYWLGASYGTFLGATYADLFPTKVGRMVLDGAIDPSLTNVELTHGQAKGFELALRRFVENCIKQSDCPLPRDVQGGLDRIQQFFDDVDSAPLPTGDKKRPLTQALAQNAVLSYLYFPPTDWEQLRYGLSSAFDGDGSVLLSMLDERLSRDESGRYQDNSNAALYAVNALDRPDRPTAAESQVLADQWSKEAPVFGAFLAWGNLPFQYWQAPATGSPHQITAPGSPKILVVGTTYDPATPYPWAQALAKQLSQGVLLTRVGDGHTGYGMGSECTDKAIDRYLLTGSTPAAGTVCR
ncbi:MAG: alpha/beta hydrolase [Candidatus Nanopelagicales bacterium]